MGNEFWPKKVSFSSIGLKSAGWFLAWSIGSIVLFILILLFQSTINQSQVGDGSGGIFPIIFCFVALISSILVSQVTYYFLILIESEKYRSSVIHFSQLAFFSVLVFVFFLPVYALLWQTSQDGVVQIFMIHMLIVSFGVALLSELLNNYRYILLELYACFVGVICTGIIIAAMYYLFPNGLEKIYSLLIILPLTNTLVIFIQWLFNRLYWHYFHITGKDALGDIFEQIKEQEREKYEESSAESTIY